MKDRTFTKLKIPPQDQTALGVFQPDRESAAEWVRNLPVGETRTTVKKLDEALGELNRTTLPPDNRYRIMETLATALDAALDKLAKQFLNQPLVLPEEPRAMVIASEQLMSAAATGYAIIAIEVVENTSSLKSANPSQLTGEAIQRALLYTGRRIRQNYQLHQPMGPDTWGILHQLYALAEQQKLADLPLPESRAGGNTVKATYAQSVTLSCCKPNQLRQSDLTALNRGLQEWSQAVGIESRESGNELFLIDLNSDQPAQYRALYREQPDADLRAVNTSALVAYLESLKEELVSKEVSFDKNTGVPLHLLDQLIASLGSISMRNFKRMASNSPLWICVGLNSTHYHVNQHQIRQQVEGGDRYVAASADDDDDGDNIFRAAPAKKGLRDKAEMALPSAASNFDQQGIDLDPNSHAMIFPEEYKDMPDEDAHPVFEVQLADTSPNGYCLEWLDDMPADLRSGDLVGLKEDREQNDWSIAVIRWLSRVRDARTLVGLELLSPRAFAFAGKVALKDSNKQEQEPPVRVLLLPAIKIIGQPATLITPRTRFKERQKVLLRNSSESRTVQLMRQISSTGSFEQFEFRVIKELGDILAEQDMNSLKGEYDSLWSDI